MIFVMGDVWTFSDGLSESETPLPLFPPHFLPPSSSAPPLTILVSVFSYVSPLCCDAARVSVGPFKDASHRQLAGRLSPVSLAITICSIYPAHHMSFTSPCSALVLFPPPTFLRSWDSIESWGVPRNFARNTDLPLLSDDIC
jgi:hypothetical protein